MKLQMKDTGGEDPRLRPQLNRDEPGDYEASERTYCRSCGMNAGLLEDMIRRVIREELADRPVAGETVGERLARRVFVPEPPIVW